MIKTITITIAAVATLALASCTNSYGTATKTHSSAGHHCSSCSSH